MFTQRQMEIVNAAINLIAREGIQSVTIKNLAHEIGVTEAAIYRHFSSKLEILLSILRLFKTQQTELVKSIQQQKSGALDRLEAFLMHRFQQFVDNPALAAVIFSEEIFQNDQELAQSINEIMEMSQRYFRGIILEGQSSQEIRTDISDEQLALIVLGSMRLLVARWHLTHHQFDLLQEGQKLWQSLKKILEM